MDLLAHPVRAALTGPHAALAESSGRVLRYRPDVTPFAALPADPGPADWADLARLGERSVLLLGPVTELPAGWSLVREIVLHQMVHDGRALPADAAGVVELGDDDVAEMTALVRLTEPGPFLTGTLRTGRYLGVRRGGRLVAMAGERMHLPAHVEASAVCTDPAHRGQGLASLLLGAVLAGVRERGATPFLHVAGTNTGAIGLYQHLGFRLTRTGSVRVVVAPTR